MAHEQSDFVGQRARALLDTFIDPIQVVSAEGTFLYVNRAWCERLGYEESDALGLGFLDLIHPDHQEPWKSIFRAVLVGERLDHIEMVLIAKDGSHLAVEGSVWAQIEGGAPTMICAVFHDSARRERGEQQISR